MNFNKNMKQFNLLNVIICNKKKIIYLPNILMVITLIIYNCKMFILLKCVLLKKYLQYTANNSTLMFMVQI